jgi:hypothetical protein
MPSGKQITWAVVVIALVLGAAFLGVKYPLPPQPEELPAAAAYQVPCHTEMGGVGYTCDDGGAFTVNSGASLALNNGASLALNNGASLAFEGATADAYETTVAVTDPTADRTITLPNLSGAVLLTTNPGKTVFGSNTITGTLKIAHGLTTPEAVFCDLGADAVANAATCSTAISGSDVTVKVWKADGATAGSVGVRVDWLVAGQP